MGPAACHFTDARGGVTFGGVDHVFDAQRQCMSQACGHNIHGHNPRPKGFADQQGRKTNAACAVDGQPLTRLQPRPTG